MELLAADAAVESRSSSAFPLRNRLQNMASSILPDFWSLLAQEKHTHAQASAKSAKCFMTRATLHNLQKGGCSVTGPSLQRSAIMHCPLRRPDACEASINHIAEAYRV